MEFNEKSHTNLKFFRSKINSLNVEEFASQRMELGFFASVKRFFASLANILYRDNSQCIQHSAHI